MSRPIIVIGDSISHGGSVVGGSPATDIEGRQVARLGDPVACRKCGPTRIASGDPGVIVDGMPVARHGDRTACGATLIASQATTTIG
ncbi:PAAR domain-containing protein [Pseudoxanthomonas mexicana]|uniref:PAAR domain-containing protein n=1 Tax=Pseudoxanthomonas mexicana TaxID=128785 RepID=UPI00398B34AE